MKKKINTWIIYIFLTVVSYYLFNVGTFSRYTGVSSLNNVGLGTIKLSGEIPATNIAGRSSIIQYQSRKHFRQFNWTRVQQKGLR